MLFKLSVAPVEKIVSLLTKKRNREPKYAKISFLSVQRTHVKQQSVIVLEIGY